MGLFSTSPEEKARKEALAKAAKERESARLAKQAEENKIARENKAKEERNTKRAKSITAMDIDPKDYQAVLIEQNFLTHLLFRQLLINTGGTMGYLAGDMADNLYKERMVKFHKEYEK